MTMTMRANTTQTLRAITALKTRAPQAIARALNRSVASGKTVMVRLVAQDMGLKQSDVRNKIGVRSATPERHTAALTASPKRIPLIEFSAKGPMPSRGRGGGVRANRKRYPHLFIAKMPSGHRGVFGRTPGKFMRNRPNREAIDEKFGPSIAFVFTKHVAAGYARAHEQFAKNLQSELRFATLQAA